jgi:hypothetical protein
MKYIIVFLSGAISMLLIIDRALGGKGKVNDIIWINEEDIE